MSRLLAHLPPLAELHDENGLPLLAEAPPMRTSAPSRPPESGVGGLESQGVSAASGADEFDVADFDVTDEQLRGESSESMFGTPLGILPGTSDTGLLDEDTRSREALGEGIALKQGGALPETGDEPVDWDSEVTLAIDETPATDAQTAPELALDDFEQGGEAEQDGQFEDNTQSDAEWVDSEVSDSPEEERTFTEPIPPRPIREVAVMDFGSEERHFVTNPRVKRRKSSPMKTIIGVVIGGAAAFPIAAGILALVGKPLDLGFWPFDGQTIATGSSRSAAAPRDVAARPSTRPSGQSGRSLAEDIPSLAVGTNDRFYGSMDSRPGPADDLAVKAEETSNGSSVTSTASTSLSVPPSIRTQPIIDTPQNDGASPAPTDVPESANGTQTGLDDSEALTPSEPSRLDDSIEEAVEEMADEPAVATDQQSESLSDEDDGTSDPLDPTGDLTSESIADSSAPLPAGNVVSTLSPVEPSPGVVNGSDDRLGGSESEPTLPVEPILNTVSPELRIALETVDEAIQATLDHDVKADPTGIRRRLATLFASVAAVGETVSDDNEPELRSLVDRLVDEGLSKDLTPASPNWLNFSKRPNNGMFAAGRIRRNRDAWLFDWNSTTPLTLRFAPGIEPIPDANVLIIGRLVIGEPTPTVEVRLVKKID
jgi:hypothetical protein